MEGYWRGVLSASSVRENVTNCHTGMRRQMASTTAFGSTISSKDWCIAAEFEFAPAESHSLEVEVREHHKDINIGEIGCIIRGAFIVLYILFYII